MSDAHRAVEEVARTAYGRLVAHLAAQTGDVARAEDALSDALVAALGTWTRDGVPERPAAWLLAAARHRLVDQARERRVRDAHAEELGRELARLAEEATDRTEELPDERLELLFVCAHPAIDPALH